jgi:hypothetical protein
MTIAQSAEEVVLVSESVVQERSRNDFATQYVLGAGLEVR